MNVSAKIAIGIFVLCALPSAYYAVRQHNENRIIEDYLEEIALPDNASPWEAGILLSQSLRDRFVVDEELWTRMDMTQRGFLREPSDYLLEVNEGECGHGARVLVNLLLAAGYDATRVSLYDRMLHSTHTLVSLQANGEEYFIDTINTQPEVNHYLNTHQVNAASFSIVKYVDSDLERSAEARRLRAMAGKDSQSGVEERIFNRFLYYSYEALPLTKLGKAVGIDSRILSFSRPPTLISSLAEKPYRIMNIFWLGLGAGLAVLTLIIGNIAGRLRRR